MTDALELIRTRNAATPVHVQADPRQVPNHTGGWGFAVADEVRLRRFLTMGTTGGTFYVDEAQLTRENGELVLAWARDRTGQLVGLVTQISVAGRAPRQAPALLALAAALQLGATAEGRRAAERAVPAVVRTGSALATFCKYIEQFGGWGPVTRRAVSSWYLGRDPDALAYQLVKYRQRDGWTHADILRLAHPYPALPDGTVMEMHSRLFAWVTSGVVPDELMPDWVRAYLRARDIERASGSALARRAKAAAYVQLIADYPGLPWEALPDGARAMPEVWGALVDAGMPITALIRNLPTLTRLDVIAPMSARLRAVCDRLRDAELLRRGRVHPMSLLIAARVYTTGRSQKGSSRWAPIPQVTDALTDAFYLAFGAVEPAGKRTMIALDISASMGWNAAGYGCTAREMTAAMALVTMATEPAWGVYGFSHEFRPLDLSPRMRLDTVLRRVSDLPMGATNIALPMIWAAQNRVEVDTFTVWTDGEINVGQAHPHQALEAYRQTMGIGAKLQFVATVPTRISVADPADPGTLDVSGFDAAVPVLLADHSAGRL